MSAERALRVAQSIKKELAEMIRRDLKDPRLSVSGLISITEVECSPDLRAVKVFVSIFGQGDRQAIMDALNEQAGYIRGEICRRLKLRFAPELSFKLDDSLGRGSKVADLLGKISRGEV